MIADHVHVVLPNLLLLVFVHAALEHVEFTKEVKIVVLLSCFEAVTDL